jgi:hypothetical protein
MSYPIDEQALRRAQAKVAEAAEKFGPLGRPADSSCICLEYPCPCACHKDRSRKPKE